MNNENNEIGINKNTIFEKWNVKNEKELFDLITISVENELENINSNLDLAVNKYFSSSQIKNKNHKNKYNKKARNRYKKMMFNTIH